MRRALLPAAAALLALGPGLGATACDSSPDGPELRVSGAYIPQPALADMAAGYFTVTNTGDRDARLTSVTSDLAGEVTLHSTAGNAMRRVTSFTVPAGGRLVLGLGGNHLMLMKLTHKPVAGEEVSVELRFDDADPIDVRVPVKPAGYRPGD
ncbi:copper chaperone PCu(A)C [Streptomyces sp. NPDC088354]|uniref:copper chaperone PCu(A)C n=1 Tax=unclassified Streptomyces TaxID=2593676 RepID=UPI0029A11B1B|nr:copper chaperone PCu(A)C [Streptomyces sp. MI02-7b]MDX3076433.1 copper chaperone PCu(A)C [Streptomyces sp. MI02-7b]